MSIDVQRFVKVYLAVRDHRAQMRKEYEEKDAKFKRDQEKMEAVLLKACSDQNVTSIATELGTVIRGVDVLPRVDDWDAFYAFIKEHDAFEALERRAKKQFVKEYMESNEDAPPPGVSVLRQFQITVRRKS